MTVIQAVLMGLVQGLGEFLPISSSAHLVLLPWLFRWQDPGLTFDVALHAGTLLALIIYFWRDWWQLIVKGLTNAGCREGKLFWYLAVASVPGAIGGLLLEKWAETVFRNPALIAVMLILMGIILYWTDQKSVRKNDLEHITLGTSFLIGLSQVLAIIPGVSRAGITITAGLGMGLTREGATRFSFLLSTPIIFGAALMKLPQLIADPAAITGNFILAVAVSFLSGLASIGFLLRYVRTKSFTPFVGYRFALGALVLVIAMLR